MENIDEPGAPHPGGPKPQHGTLTQESEGGANPAERAEKLAGEAMDSATAAANHVRDRLKENVKGQQRQAADTVDDVAESLQRAADAMPHDQSWLSDLTTSGANRLTEFAETLRQNDLQGLLHRVGGFARKQPALFFGTSMIAGFALARTAQASVGRARGLNQHAHQTEAEQSHTPSKAETEGTGSHEDAGAGDQARIHQTEAHHG